MDFKTVTGKILASFSEHNIAYGLIGGYAMGLWGVQRATVDMDFLVQRDDMPKVHSIMTSMGYEVRFSSENVTQYISPIRLLGEIDYLHAFRQASISMLERTVEKQLFQNGLTVKVLIPEDLIGLKLQAFSNNATREELDMYDIEWLMRNHGKTMDWELIRSYFEIFESLPLFLDLREKYGPDK